MRFARRIWGFSLADAGLDRRRHLNLAFVAIATLSGGAFVGTGGGFETAIRWLQTTAADKLQPFGGAMGRTGTYATILAMAVLLMASVGYSLWVPIYGPERKKWAPVVWANALANLLEMATTACLFLLIGAGIGAVSGFGQDPYGAGQHVFQSLRHAATQLVTGALPAVAVIPGPLAILFLVLVRGASNYWEHRLCHTSRLLWLVVHRSHHIPEYLTPMITPGVVFGFLFHIPALVFSAVLLALFPTDANVTILIVYYTIWGITAQANHSTALYRLVYRIPIFKQLCHCFATGPYHYLHHSAHRDEMMVNLDLVGPFMFWDRLFGTYKAPPPSPPTIGLTHSPDVLLSPFVILFSGYQQLAYELRWNKGWTVRAKIVFGSIAYSPPITRDFLTGGLKRSVSEGASRADVSTEQLAPGQ